MLHYIDRMTKPVVAAVNGLAMGGGVETMFRCHSVVADKKAYFRLPEITLGILPGMGGLIIPYRKWPQAAETFHEMIGKAKIIKAAEAREIGIVNHLVDSFSELIDVAMQEVQRLQGNIPRISDAPVDIPEFIVPDQPAAVNGDPLSKEVLALIADVINRGAKTEGLYKALEINYERSGDTHCLEDSKEGVMAFLQKRKPSFKK
jgi:enoyl-CoA hydratase/carnithine racemase